MEACEHYQKQSYRNRCYIYAESGAMPLSVPVVHENGYKLPIRDIRVDYSTPWLLRTERAIDSAYRTSAYFEYYREELFALLETRPARLFDLNLQIIRFFLSKTGLLCHLRLTEDYAAEAEEDYRAVIHPKRPNTVLEDSGLNKPYFQVFARKYGFIAHLSIMDLVFNEGPGSVSYLKR